MHIGKRIKKLRKSLNIESKDLANGIISYKHLNNIENGKFNTSNDILIALAQKINVPKDYLLKFNKENEKLRKLLLTLKENIDNLNLNEAKMNLKQNQHEIYETYMKESIKYFYKHKLWKHLDIAEELGIYYQQLKKYKLSSHYFKIALEAIKNIK